MTNARLPCQIHEAYFALWATKFFVGSEAPKHNDLNKKFKFHFEHFPRNTPFLSFCGPSNYLHLFLTFSWPGESPSSHLKVTKMWFSAEIKYLLESFFADFGCREGISFNCIKGHIRSNYNHCSFLENNERNWLNLKASQQSGQISQLGHIGRWNVQFSPKFYDLSW